MPRTRYSRYSRDYQALVGLMREARLKAGLTQAQVAKAMRTDQTVISKMERGVFRVDLLDWLSFLDAIQADPVIFLKRFLGTSKQAR